MEKNALLPPKLSLAKALAAIAEILTIAEEGGNDDEAIGRCLAIADEQLSASVDRRVGFVVALSGGSLSVSAAQGLIGSMKLREEAVRHERKMLEKILERIKESTQQLMVENGYDELKGTIGEFKLQGSAPSLECVVPVYSRSYSNLITPGDTLDYHIPSQYLVYEQIATLNKELVKEDLKRGEIIPWAHLKYNKQIRMKHCLSIR